MQVLAPQQVIHFVITDAGRAAAIEADGRGAKVKITHVAFGEGKKIPTKKDTSLIDEKQRLATVSGNNPSSMSIHVTVTDQTDASYDVYEMALYLESGIMFARAGITGMIPINNKTKTSVLLFAMEIPLAGIPASSVTIADQTMNYPLATLTQEGTLKTTSRQDVLNGSEDRKAISPASLKAASDESYGSYVRVGQFGVGQLDKIPDISLNAMTQLEHAGKHFQNDSTKATPERNYPVKDQGVLIVDYFPNGAYQQYTGRSNSRVFTRTYIKGSGWTPWNESYSRLVKPTARELNVTEEPPQNNKTYIRKYHQWVETSPVDTRGTTKVTNSIPFQPGTGGIHGRLSSGAEGMELRFPEYSCAAFHSRSNNKEVCRVDYRYGMTIQKGYSFCFGAPGARMQSEKFLEVASNIGGTDIPYSTHRYPALTITPHGAGTYGIANVWNVAQIDATEGATKRLIFHVGGSRNAVTIDHGANLVARGNITAFSDKALKTDLKNIPDALNKVKALNGYTFKRKDTGAIETGVIAQEVEKVLPEAVMSYDYLEHKAVAYGNMVGLLIEAIKEQQQQIEELRSKVG